MFNVNGIKNRVSIVYSVVVYLFIYILLTLYTTTSTTTIPFATTTSEMVINKDDLEISNSGNYSIGKIRENRSSGGIRKASLFNCQLFSKRYNVHILLLHT